MRTAPTRGRIVRYLTVAVLATLYRLGCHGTAIAQEPDCAGRSVPTSKVSIQLWTFAEYVGFGTDAATIARLEEVLSSLSEMGYRNVEPLTLSGLSAEEYRALLDKYGLKASARHVTIWVTPKTMEAHVRSIFRKLDLPSSPPENRREHAVLTFLGR